MKEIYEVVRHDGGWAYRVKDVFSETFATEDAAREAAEAAAGRQQLAGDDTDIAYQDAAGRVRVEHASGDDRPETAVEVTDLGGADAVLRGEAEDELEAEAILSGTEGGDEPDADEDYDEGDDGDDGDGGNNDDDDDDDDDEDEDEDDDDDDED